jgi:hypothetical protein
VTVVITDECPGDGVCGSGKTHFDLSGAAIHNIISPGRSRDGEISKIGVVPILFRRYSVKSLINLAHFQSLIRPISIVFKTHNLKDDFCFLSYVECLANIQG